MSEQDEVNEQARLNGMGAERELALMAKLEAATRARQQAQEALYAERDRHAATVKKMQADLEMRTDESVRYRGVLDATVIVIEEMRQEIESLQAGGGEAGHVGDTRFEGWLSESVHKGSMYLKQDMRESYWAGYQERAALQASRQPQVQQGGGNWALDVDTLTTKEQRNG